VPSRGELKKQVGEDTMGQYQQWLYYQEVDRRLRADLEALESELAQIQEQLRTLEQTIPLTDNTIIHALAASLSGQYRTQRSSESTSSEFSDAATDSPLETISPALYGWGRLPNFGPQDMQVTCPPDRVPLSHPENSVPLTPHPEMALLPEDMVAFFNAHDQTDPQLELPWWLSKIAASANGAQRTRSIDNESIRTNHLVQRWRERWGRPVSIEQPSEKSEDTANE